MAEPASSIQVKGQTMEYKVLSGPFNAGELERDLNRHAAEGWRVAGTFQAISWMKSRTPTVIVLERARA
jgi:hypothetical protein